MQRKWLFFSSAVILQLLLLAVVLIPRMSILARGKTVVLETMPYDPYSVLRGYYVNLRYRISDPGNLPGQRTFKERQDYFVILTPNARGIWQPVSVSGKLPQHLKADQAVIRGRYRYGSLDYSIGQYYLPETKRRHIEEILRNTRNTVLVELKTKADGSAALVKLKVGRESFEY